MSDQSQGPGWWMASDGKWYPPQPPDGPPPAPAPAQKQGMHGCLKALLIGGVLAVVLGVGCVAVIDEAADEVSEESEARQERIRKDVELVDCRTGEFGWMEAEVRVTNNSSERSNYWIEVTFESPDGADQYETGIAAASALRPDQSATDVAGSLTEPPGEFTCDITDVSRTSDET